MDPISTKLDLLEAKIDRVLLNQEPLRAEVVGVAEAMCLTGAKTPRTLYDHLRLLGVKPYARGKYRRVEITNAIGLRVLRAQKKT